VRLVTWSYNPKFSLRQASDICVVALVPLSHVLMYAPSIHSRSALISKPWLEITQNLFDHVV